jgi:hypothetical protein
MESEVLRWLKAVPDEGPVVQEEGFSNGNTDNEVIRE